MLPFFLENLNDNKETDIVCNTRKRKGGWLMLFTENEAVCCLAVALRADKKDPRFDIGALYIVANEILPFATAETLKKSAHLYAAFITRFLHLYEESGKTQEAALAEILKECLAIFGQNGEGLCEHFYTTFLTEPSLPSAEELNRLNAEMVTVAQFATRSAGQNERSASAAPRRFGGTTTVEILCPGPHCVEKKRCDRNTKRFHCKKCGFDAPFKDGKIVLP